MDKKDQIILQQLDVIRSMTENNVRRMGSDFWGTPFQDVGKAPAAPEKPAEPEKPVPPTAERAIRVLCRRALCGYGPGCRV